MDFAGRNVTSSFDFMQELVRAKDLPEMLELQASYINTQMQVLAEQWLHILETPELTLVGFTGQLPETSGGGSFRVERYFEEGSLRRTHVAL